MSINKYTNIKQETSPTWPLEDTFNSVGFDDAWKSHPNSDNCQ